MGQSASRATHEVEERRIAVHHARKGWPAWMTNVALVDLMSKMRAKKSLMGDRYTFYDASGTCIEYVRDLDPSLVFSRNMGTPWRRVDGPCGRELPVVRMPFALARKDLEEEHSTIQRIMIKEDACEIVDASDRGKRQCGTYRRRSSGHGEVWILESLACPASRLEWKKLERGRKVQRRARNAVQARRLRRGTHPPENTMHGVVSKCHDWYTSDEAPPGDRPGCVGIVREMKRWIPYTWNGEEPPAPTRARMHTRVHPDFNCRWGDPFYRGTCQLLLQRAGANKATLRSKADAGPWGRTLSGRRRVVRM